MSRMLRFVLALAALVAASAVASAQYPTRPVRLVVGFAPGGPTDILARHMAQYLTTKLGQQFVVENKPGATGNIATEYVMGQPADGYTILVTTTANAINMTFLQKLTTNFMRDMEPVAGLASFTYMMLVNPGVPAKSIPEFIAYAKANPGKINFASGGVGSSNQLAVELFKSMTGTDLVHVPYRGNAAAYPDLISGNIQLIFADIASGRPHAQSGALRALGVTAAKRLATLPDVPAIAETVPGYEADGWYGFAAPKGTPRRRDREAQRRDQRRSRRSGACGALRAARGKAARLHAAGIRRVSRLGSGALGQGREGVRRAWGLGRRT